MMQKKRPGRRAFRPTRRQRRRVELLAGEVPLAAIAHDLGISVPTLRLRFGAELAHGRTRVLGDALVALDAAARSGNASAAKAMILRKDSLFWAPAAKPPNSEGARRGKKAEADAAALDGPEGTPWAGLLQ